MEALFILLIFSLLLGGGFLAAFFWAQKNGQFEDTETPALRILFDDADAARRKIQHNISLKEKDHQGCDEKKSGTFVSNAPAIRHNHDTSRIKGVPYGS